MMVTYFLLTAAALSVNFNADILSYLLYFANCSVRHKIWLFPSIKPAQDWMLSGHVFFCYRM